MQSTRTFEARGFHQDPPSAWYQVAWSGELVEGDVRALRYFGRELVLFRDAEGGVHVFDAHCAHLGADLGVGGTVVGTELQCPFHGWRWDVDGRNTLIPYSDQRCKGRTLRVWPVVEHSGLVLVWFDASGGAPTFEVAPIPEASSSNHYPAYPDGIRLWSDVAIHPQSPTENLVDPAHLKYVHGAGEIVMGVDAEYHGAVFTKTTKMHFGVGRESTIVTPNGPTTGFGTAEAWGLGYFISRFDVDGSGVADMVMITATTPVDEYRSDLRQTVIPRRDGPDAGEEWTKLARWWVKEERRQAERDFPIWENMRQIEHPPFAREESKDFRAMRTWARQFYRSS